MVCFVQVRVSSIHVYYIRTSHLRSDNQMKTIHNFGMNSDFRIFSCKKLNVHIFFILLNTGWQTMKCVLNTVEHNVISFLFHKYTGISYSHTSWLVCAWNVTLHDFCVKNDISKFSIPCWYTDDVFDYTYNHVFIIWCQNLCVSTSWRISSCRLIIS